MGQCAVAARFVGQKGRRRLVDGERPGGEQEAGAVGQLVEVVRPGLQFRHGADQLALLVRVDPEPPEQSGSARRASSASRM